MTIGGIPDPTSSRQVTTNQGVVGQFIGATRGQKDLEQTTGTKSDPMGKLKAAKQAAEQEEAHHSEGVELSSTARSHLDQTPVEQNSQETGGLNAHLHHHVEAEEQGLEGTARQEAEQKLDEELLDDGTFSDMAMDDGLAPEPKGEKKTLREEEDANGRYDEIADQEKAKGGLYTRQMVNTADSVDSRTSSKKTDDQRIQDIAGDVPQGVFGAAKTMVANQITKHGPTAALKEIKSPDMKLLDEIKVVAPFHGPLEDISDNGKWSGPLKPDLEAAFA